MLKNNLIKKIYKKNSKARHLNNSSISGLLINRLAILFSIFFIKLKIRPNTITILNVIFSSYILIYVFISQNVNFSYLIFLYLIRILFDNIDGTIARVNNNKTFFGKFLDSTTDILFVVYFNFGIVFFYYKLFEDLNFFILGIIATIMVSFDSFIYDKYSSLVRWSNLENNKKNVPYLRKKYFSRVFFTFEDLIFFSFIILAFIDIRSGLFAIILLLILLTQIFSSVSNLILHFLFSYQYLNIKKK